VCLTEARPSAGLFDSKDMGPVDLDPGAGLGGGATPASSLESCDD
jgi:hypothetical protein